MIEQALDFIDEMCASGLKVLIHCVAGRSRSPSITLLYLAARLNVLPTVSFEEAEEGFRCLYPHFSPIRGIREHIRRYWQQYCDDGRRKGGRRSLLAFLRRVLF